MERKVCFILDAGNLVVVGDACPKADSPLPRKSGASALIDGGRGLRAEPAQAAPTGILNLVIGGLTSVILMVLGTVSLQF